MKKKAFILLAVSIFIYISGVLFPLHISIQAGSNPPGFEVEHSIEGHNLELYFNVRNFSLSKDHGWVVLTIDGKSPMKIVANQKRLTGLSSGKHHIKAYLQGKDNRMIGTPIEFDVIIP
jgi:hypothetical protein